MAETAAVRARGFWPRIPRSVLGRAIPKRFRGSLMRFRDPDRVLIEFIDWIERDVRKGDGRVDGVAERDREVLIMACVELSDRVNEALRDRLIQEMGKAGIEAINADGERFDPERHRAIHRLSNGNAAQRGTVASTERLGFADRGRLIRLPEVSVYAEE